MFAWLVMPARDGADARTLPGKRNASWKRGAFAFPVMLAALLLAPLHAVASDKQDAARLPLRKAGLWEVTISAHSPEGLGGARQPAVTVRQCTRADVDALVLLSILPGQENCAAPKVAKLGDKGNGRVVTTACRVHDNQVRGRMELRGDLQSVYAGRYSVEFAQTPQQDVGPVSFQGRWLGSCAPGQKPGDMVLPNGITVNVVDAAARASKHAH